MCMVRIPQLSRAAGAPLGRCLDKAAAECGVDTATLAIGFSKLWESIADENSMGECVQIPGFGLFGPKLVRTRKSIAGLEPARCRPHFVPSRGYYSQVLYGAPPKDGGNLRLRAYSKNHQRVYSGDRGQRVFSAAEKFREDIRSQMGE